MAFLEPNTFPHDFPRQYLPASVDLGHWPSVESFFKELENRVLSSTEDLKKWLTDWMEFEDALAEEGSLRYIRMTCRTDDAQIEKKHLEFLEQILEAAKSRSFALMRKYRDCAHRSGLPEKEFFPYDRSVKTQLALFREENMPLETELEKLSQQYQKLSGSLTVQYESREQTLQQMGRYQEHTDRKKREEAWRLVAERRLREKESFEDLFDRMLELRARISRNAGFGNYRDFRFQQLERFDYGPKDCESFHETAEKIVKPLVEKIQRRRARKMGLQTLWPWDLSVDPEGKAPLKPFDGTEKLIAGCGAILDRIDPEFGRNFRTMRELGLLDLESRKGKAPGGYQSDLGEARLPFVFMNAVGMDNDVRTLLHEGGHAMHCFASRHIPFSPYRHAPTEFCEVASMSMELLADAHLGAFYPEAKDAARSITRHWESVITLLPWIATVDAFQHWIYTHPGHTGAERSGFWIALQQRFGGIEDWSGLEEYRASFWHRQLHIFEYPFYYIEYAIAQLGALQVWMNVRRDKAEGIRLYQQGMSAGASRTLPELFKSAGIRFDFSPKMIEPLMEEVDRELEKLGGI